MWGFFATGVALTFKPGLLSAAAEVLSAAGARVAEAEASPSLQLELWELSSRCKDSEAGFSPAAFSFASARLLLLPCPLLYLTTQKRGRRCYDRRPECAQHLAK